MVKLGIAMQSWHRPDYLRQCLESLAANDLRDVDVHLWQEGQYCRVTGQQRTSTEEIAGCVTAFERAAMPHKFTHVHEQHVGCAVQQLILMPYMAERYEQFIVLTDDVVVSRYCVPVMRRIMEQYAGDPKIGSISPSFRLHCPEGEIKEKRNKLMRCGWGDGGGIGPGPDAGNWNSYWAEGWWSDKWNMIWPNYEEYCQVIEDVPFQIVGSKAGAVAEWARREGSGISEPSSDTALLRATELVGQERLRLVVNRATGIGDYGLNCTPEILARLGDGHQLIYEWVDEPVVEMFERL